jgi:hypothetical protein
MPTNLHPRAVENLQTRRPGDLYQVPVGSTRISTARCITRSFSRQTTTMFCLKLGSSMLQSLSSSRKHHSKILSILLQMLQTLSSSSKLKQRNFCSTQACTKATSKSRSHIHNFSGESQVLLSLTVKLFPFSFQDPIQFHKKLHGDWFILLTNIPYSFVQASHKSHPVAFITLPQSLRAPQRQPGQICDRQSCLSKCLRLLQRIMDNRIK